jgi:hypothetical protein
MLACLCCFSKKDLENDYSQPLLEESKEESAVKDAEISPQKTAEQNVVSDKVQCEVQKPTEPTETEDRKISQSNDKVSNETGTQVQAKQENDKVGPTNLKVSEKATDKEGVSAELKVEIKTEENQQDKSENIKVEKENDVEHISPGSQSKDNAVNSIQTKFDKWEKNMDQDLKPAAPPKPETAVPESENRPATQSIKLNNISRAVVENAKKEEVKKVIKKLEEKLDGE